MEIPVQILLLHYFITITIIHMDIPVQILFMKWTSAPPLQRSRRWSPQVPRIGNSTIIIVLLCKQDCTPSRHFVFGLSQPLAARRSAYHLIKDKYKYPSFTSVRLGIEALGYNSLH